MTEFEGRLAAVDWNAATQSLDEHGCTTIPKLIAPAQCVALAAMYEERERFRARVVMERVRFGVGEYKYFASPLPPVVAALRTAIYPHLAPIANRWLRAMGREAGYPAAVAYFIEICWREGEARSPSLRLRYEKGGYNCRHQDLFGEVAFPIQLTC